MRRLWWLLTGAMLAQKIWKHWLVWRFFRRPIPRATREPERVSLLQPILSGDPTLAECLRANLAVRSRYSLEFIWLVDADDSAAQAICGALAAQYTQHPARIVTLPPPGQRDNPKMIKLIAGLAQSRGDVICVLDDDTRLPDWGLEQCLPYLDQPGVGVAFGLPYYRSFDTIWSSLVSLFVNDQSLLNYIPYTALTEPFTLNGMFYAARRDVLDRVGGFAGLEGILADDFAVASRFRAHGYRLAQTPLCHAISTTVRGPRQYLSLIRRWFIFPRESLLRHLNAYDRAVLYIMGVLPALFPLLLLVALKLKPSARLWAYVAIYFGHSALAFRQIDAAYLRRATPARYRWLAPLVELLFPFQLIAALLARQRIVWRGHIMQVERGGGFHFIRRRE
ncbi:MAG TPA: glycosyltransferase [Roseiflexaceae bacterium]|nr:glycosyltransferase [Roseiflexaceae bacterium]